MAEATYTQSVTITTNFNQAINILDEDARIMRWLSPLEPQNRHQGVRIDRFDGVGDWLLETTEFREWRTRRSDGGTDEAVLFCFGNPGVGKTYISSLVIDSLCDQAGMDNIAVACLYYDFLAQQEQTITNMMGAILKQLLGRGGISDDVREEYQLGEMEIGSRELRLPDLAWMLKTTIALLPQVFICIDALDECLPKHLPELLESLRDIVRESPTTRIFLTGRPHVGEDIRRCFTKAVTLPISSNTDDIKSYLEMRLARDPEPEAMNDDLRADILKIIPEKISDTFLLVSLNIDAILGEVTVRQRRKKLEEMTQGNGLSDAYTATVNRVKAQKGYKSTLGMKVLMWVSHSERPLRADELCRAMGVEIGSTDLDLENVPALQTLLRSSLGLVTVEASSSTIRLIHLTLQEYISNDPALFCGGPHSLIAEVCLTYLNSQCIRELSPIYCSEPSTIPFLDYASCHWARHAGKEITENVKTLAVRLLDGFEKHISAQLVLWRFEQERCGWERPYVRRERVMRFTGLHGAAFFGVVQIVFSVLGMKEWDVNALDGTGSTALIWAARRGYEGASKLLLAREDVNPNTADTKYGKTPLCWAAENGNHALVKMLLAREDVNPSTPDTQYGRTPLCWAAGNGQDAVVKTLLAQEGVNPNTPDTNWGQTPLCWAAESGHDAVVKTLLAQEDVNPNTLATYGWTSLCWAAKNGHDSVVKTLLAREDVNPSTPDTQYGRTPLSWAAGNGQDAVVKTLLAREDVNPNTPDTQWGQIPLCWAAKNGHDSVVKTLLAREDVNPNMLDSEYGRASLLWAVKGGHAKVVKIFLERENICIDSPDNKNKTPLSMALSKGHNEIATMLQEAINSRTTRTDVGGQAIISQPVEGGEECGSEKQSGSGDLGPDIVDPHAQQTPSSTDLDEREQILDCQNYDPSCRKSHLTSTKHFSPPPPSPELPLHVSPITADTQPHNSRSTLPIAIDRYLIISSFICLLAFLIYTFPSLLPSISFFNK